MTRYFITGAQGFVGRYLIAHLLKEQTQARIMGVGRSARMKDRFTHKVQWGAAHVPAPLTGCLASIESDSRYGYATIDVNRVHEIEPLLAEFHPDVVIHLASGLRDDPPESLFRTNVGGTIHLLEAIGRAATGVIKIVVGSSGGVYGAPSRLPIRECHACAPVDFYSISKLAQEHAGRVSARQKNLKLSIARIFNIVGPGQDERHICGQFAACVAGILSNQLPLVINHGPLQTTRDLIDVRDTARAIAMIADPNAPEGVYNVAGGIESSMQEVLDICLRLAGLEHHVVLHCNRGRTIDIPRHVASTERLRSLGYARMHTLSQSLRDLLAYYLEDVRTASLSGLPFAQPEECSTAITQKKSAIGSDEGCS